MGDEGERTVGNGWLSHREGGEPIDQGLRKLEGRWKELTK